MQNIKFVSFQGMFTRITFREDLYLGGYENINLIGARTKMKWGFVGCVRRLVINGRNYDMRKGPFVGDAIHGLDVGQWIIVTSVWNVGKVWSLFFTK